MPEAYHIYPMWGRDHITEGIKCWCHPLAYKVCPEDCPETPDPTNPPCWQCQGEGIIPATAYEIAHIEACSQELLIVHNITKEDHGQARTE